MIRSVAFDFDGTLVDSNPIKRSAFYAACDGYPGAAALLDTVLARGGGATRLEVMAYVAERLEPDHASLAETLVERYAALTTERVIAAAPMPGVGEMLEVLRATGLPLYIVSATPEAPLVDIVARRGESALFERILGAPTTKADHLRGILGARGIAPGELCFVGDRDEDHRAACAVGCKFVGVLGCDDGFTETPEIAISDLRDLPAAL